MKKIISIILVLLLLSLVSFSTFSAKAAQTNIPSITASDDDFDYEYYDDDFDDDYSDDDDYDDDDDDYDDDDDDYDDDDDFGDYDEDEDDDDKDDVENETEPSTPQYDDSVEGVDPAEKETSYTATEKSADENNFIAYQYCGDSLNWYIRNDELIIFGRGEMYEYDFGSVFPWHGKYYTKITIRHGVTSISDYAFEGTYAKEISLPSSVTKIGGGAFKNASFLERVALDKGMISVGDYAFYGCVKLEEVTFNNNLSKIGVSAFENCTSLGDIRFPKTLKYIYSKAFKGCTSLCSVILRTGQLEIRDSVFENCSQLKTINMPNTITIIGDCAFKNCEKISFDNLPENLVEIGESTFERCDLINAVTLPNKVATVSANAFKDSGVKTITIDSALKSFNTNMLSGCQNVVVNVKCNTAAYKAFKKVSGYTVNCSQHDNKLIPKCKATFKKDGVASGYVCESCGEKTNYKPVSHISAVVLKSKILEYTGNPVQPKVTAYSADGKTIAAKNYSVTYTDKRIKVGKKKVKVVFTGDYSGSKVLYYSIVPQKPVLSKVSAKDGSFTATWKKNTTQKDGYQIQYSKSKSFSKRKSVKVKSPRAVTKTIKSSFTGKVYVRVRAYKKISRKTYYSGYSKVKSVTV